MRIHLNYFRLRSIHNLCHKLINFSSSNALDNNHSYKKLSVSGDCKFNLRKLLVALSHYLL